MVSVSLKMKPQNYPIRMMDAQKLSTTGVPWAVKSIPTSPIKFTTSSVIWALFSVLFSSHTAYTCYFLVHLAKDGPSHYWCSHGSPFRHSLHSTRLCQEEQHSQWGMKLKLTRSSWRFKQYFPWFWAWWYTTKQRFTATWHQASA